MVSSDAAAPRRAHRRRVDPLRLVRSVLVVLLLLVIGWLAWLWFLSDWAAGRRADNSIAELRQHWVAEPIPTSDEPQLLADPRHGEAEWLISLPSLDGAREWPVVVGAEEASLPGAVVWYRGTAQPGQVGNFAVAGNCLGDGAAFEDIRLLEPGDEVIVESRDAVFTYEVVSSPGDLTVQADQSWVLGPVPGHGDTEPSQALITLTTCEDRIPTDDRAVGFGVLTVTELKQ